MIREKALLYKVKMPYKSWKPICVTVNSASMPQMVGLFSNSDLFSFNISWIWEKVEQNWEGILSIFNLNLNTVFIWKWKAWVKTQI